jgi:MFS family permease
MAKGVRLAFLTFSFLLTSISVYSLDRLEPICRRLVRLHWWWPIRSRHFVDVRRAGRKYRCCSSPALSYILFGTLQNPAYLNRFNIAANGGDDQSAIVASMPAGSLVGALTVTWLGDRLGRKRTIMLAGWLWVIGSTLQCAAVNRGMLVVGRVISGLCVGLASSIVPVYQSEITAPAIRGRMVSLQQWYVVPPLRAQGDI